MKQLRGFLGLSGYYRRFIRGYAMLAATLIDLLRKDNFKWGEQEEQAFVNLKEKLVAAPVLCLLDFTKEFIIETDASDVGLGAVLMQGDKPIAYFSKKNWTKIARSFYLYKGITSNCGGHSKVASISSWGNFCGSNRP